MHNDGMFVDMSNKSYVKVVHLDGVRITAFDNVFEITAKPGSDIWEQYAVQMLKDWIRWRKKQLLESEGQ